MQRTGNFDKDFNKSPAVVCQTGENAEPRQIGLCWISSHLFCMVFGDRHLFRRDYVPQVSNQMIKKKTFFWSQGQVCISLVILHWSMIGVVLTNVFVGSKSAIEVDYIVFWQSPISAVCIRHWKVAAALQSQNDIAWNSCSRSNTMKAVHSLSVFTTSTCQHPILS